jgi:hypothetical protein
LAPFTIAGDAGVLEPGATQRLNLYLTNPNLQTLTITGIRVILEKVIAPQATGALPCTAADFVITQFSGAYPITVPATSTRSLQELAIPSISWPQVAIVDSPADQDGCKGASLTLAYSGSATVG